MDGSASPRKPRLATRSRSSNSAMRAEMRVTVEVAHPRDLAICAWADPATMRVDVVTTTSTDALVDHEAAARSARQRIQLARRSGTARAESRAIHHRHGTRRRGPRHTQILHPQAELFDDGA